jgi:hypothetical protein
VTFADVITAIEESFPFGARPPDENLMEHPTGCLLCDCEREWILERSEPHPAELSEDAARGASLELTCFSAAGVQWLMPSLLRCALQDSSGDNLVAERLIYRFAAGLDSDFLQNLNLLTSDQIGVIIQVLVFSAATDFNEFYQNQLLRAIAFLRSI